MLEKHLVKHILEYLRGIGAYAGKIKTTGRWDTKRRCFIKDPMLFKGVPDLLCFHKKRMFFIEVKTTTDQTDFQILFERLCREAGVNYILAYSVGDVEKIIN